MNLKNKVIRDNEGTIMSIYEKIARQLVQLEEKINQPLSEFVQEERIKGYVELAERFVEDEMGAAWEHYLRPYLEEQRANNKEIEEVIEDLRNRV